MPIVKPQAPAFVAGTRLGFNQTTAPTGWVKDTTAALNDSIMRIVTGAAGSGGSNAFSTFNGQTATAAHTLSVSEIPSHSHSAAVVTNTLSSTNFSMGTSANGNTGATGGGGAHSHGITASIKYNDFIVASKS